MSYTAMSEFMSRDRDPFGIWLAVYESQSRYIILSLSALNMNETYGQSSHSVSDGGTTSQKI